VHAIEVADRQRRGATRFEVTQLLACELTHGWLLAKRT
jgi:hypothetical protein